MICFLFYNFINIGDMIIILGNTNFGKKNYHSQILTSYSSSSFDHKKDIAIGFIIHFQILAIKNCLYFHLIAKHIKCYIEHGRIYLFHFEALIH